MQEADLALSVAICAKHSVRIKADTSLSLMASDS